MAEEILTKDRLEKFGPLWPVIPGAVVLLIGILVFLFHNVNGIIICYVGVMAMIVAGGHIWAQTVREQPDHEAAKQTQVNSLGRRTQLQNAIFVACCVAGAVITGLTIVCVATLTVFKGGMAPGLFGGLASLFAGGFAGFLFSIPNENQQPNSALLINTSLNQIAEWLTKIIVGVSLVNAQNAYTFFKEAAHALGAGLASGPQQPAADAFAAGLIVTFFFLGFISTYLLTRLWISVAIVVADQLALALSSGPPTMTVPNAVGSPQDAATTAIRAAKLMVGTVTPQTSDTVASGIVISQDPASATSVSGGSPVNLVISSGPQQAVTVPNVVGSTQDAATTAITGAKLVVGAVTQQSDNTVATGNVTSQDPTSGSSVTQGSPVNLVISSGPQR
jgi:PASTA domain